MLSRSDSAKIANALSKAHSATDADGRFRAAYDAGVSQAIQQVAMVVGGLSGGRVDGVQFYKTAHLTEEHFAQIEAQLSNNSEEQR